MYTKNNSQINIKFLKFLTHLTNSNNSYTLAKEIVYTVPFLEKVNTVKTFTVAANVIKNSNELKFIITISKLTANASNADCILFTLLLAQLSQLKFFSNHINTNIINYTNKNNFINIQVTNLTLYLSLRKYSFIFTKDKKNIQLENFLITNVSEISQEITEIKPDKAKKIYFKKKQTKTYTYINEINKNYTYIDTDEIDEKILEKDLFIKNIFLNLIADKSKEKTIYSSHRIVSNKSLSF